MFVHLRLLSGEEDDERETNKTRGRQWEGKREGLLRYSFRYVLGQFPDYSRLISV